MPLINLRCASIGELALIDATRLDPLGEGNVFSWARASSVELRELSRSVDRAAGPACLPFFSEWVFLMAFTVSTD